MRRMLGLILASLIGLMIGETIFQIIKLVFHLKMVSKPSEVLGTVLKADWTGIPRFGSVTYAYRQL
jgi:hypothetical protein